MAAAQAEILPAPAAKDPDVAIMDALPAGLTDRQRQTIAGGILLAIDAAGWRFASKTDDRLRIGFRAGRLIEGDDL